MISRLDPAKVDWNNSGVVYLMEYFEIATKTRDEKIDQLEKQIAHLIKENDFINLVSGTFGLTVKRYFYLLVNFLAINGRILVISHPIKLQLFFYDNSNIVDDPKNGSNVSSHLLVVDSISLLTNLFESTIIENTSKKKIPIYN